MKNRIQKLVDMLTAVEKSISPTNMKMLAHGRDWLKTGCVYSCHDIDVLIGLQAAIRDTAGAEDVIRGKVFNRQGKLVTVSIPTN